jgi:tetratricopeptide (TPR) repeat protein
VNADSRVISKKSRVRPIGLVLLIAALLAVVPIQDRIAGERGVYGPIEDILYMPSGQILQRLSLGNEGLLADIYWTRVVQYFGRKRLNQDVRFDLLGPLLRITTELDPHLLIAYRFGAIFLAGRAPDAAGRPDEAIHLLERGIVNNPDYWRLWQDLGFVYYWDLKDFRQAVRIFETGSERPGAQVWLKAIAAMVASKGGDAESSKILWMEIYRNAENDQMKQSAIEHLAALSAHEQIQMLNRRLSQYRERVGKRASKFEDLVKLGLLRGIPVDPTGIPYVIEPDGQAALGAKSTVKLRLLL